MSLTCNKTKSSYKKQTKAKLPKFAKNSQY